MNKIIQVVLIVVAGLAIVAYVASKFLKEDTQRLSPQATVEFTDNDLAIKMVYCRPFKRDRLIFGSADENALQPFGQYWRLGANEATTLETNKSLIIMGNELPVGKYSIYAVPDKETWQFGINSVANRWGLNEPDYTQDLFTFEIPVSYTDEIKEQFTISISEEVNQYAIQFWWDTSRLVIPFSVE